MAGKPGESQEAQAEASRPAATSPDADQNYNAGSGSSNAGSGTGSPGASGGDRDRQDGGNTGGGDGGKAARDAADDARARATQDAVDRERQRSADAARESQARVDAAAAETRRQMAEAEQARLDSVARQEAVKNLGIPSLMTNTFSTTPMSMPSGLNPTIPGGMMADPKNLFDFGYTDPTSTAMRMQGDTERNLNNLGTLDPSFQTKIAGTLDDVMNSGQNPYLVSTARTFTPAQLPGGAKPAEDSYHKYGLAADIGLTGGTAQDYANMGAIGYDRGLGWGGSFSNNYDPEHLQAGPVDVGATEYATAMDIPRVSVSGQPFLPSGSPGVGDQIASASKYVADVITNAPENTLKALNTAYDALPSNAASLAIQAGAYAINPLLGAANTVSGFFNGPTLQGTFLGGPTAQQEFNRDRQMTQEEVNIAEFNRLYPNAGSDKELYGGNDNRGIASLPKTPKKPVLPTTTPEAPLPPVYTTGIDFTAGNYQGPPISTETYSPNPEYYAGYNRLG